MPQTTPKYKLEYFKGGSYWDSGSEYRRFWTLDYNLDSYVGVVGVGIIDGWTVESVSGLIVKVLPGSGLINGFSAESPYTVKQRSDMVAGDREVGVINESQTTEDNLADTNTVSGHDHFIVSLSSGTGSLGDSIGIGTSHTHLIVGGVVQPPSAGITHTHTLPSQRFNYIAVIQLYDSTYNPTGEIENSYVKTVVPTTITLLDNTDNYIYAKLPSGAKPYPLLPSPPRPPVPGAPPNRSSYSSYDTYKIAYDAWNAQVTALNDYKWYDDAVNHFTAVEFERLSRAVTSNKKVLLAKVVTRSGVIRTIDVSMVDSLKNMESTIARFAKEYIVEHHHGGNKFYDPPKIKLETDIRDAVLSKYESNTNKVTFNVVEKDYTSIILGHKHTYRADANGDGITIDQIGSTSPHYHVITGYVVGDPLGNSLPVDSHTHTVTTPSQRNDTWNSDSRFVIYVNDAMYADETSTNVTVSSTKKNIVFNGGINVAYNRYSCSFPVSLQGWTSTTSGLTLAPSIQETYSFEMKTYSIYYFMLSMINDFNRKYETYFNEQESAIVYDGSGNPIPVNPLFPDVYTVSNIAIVEANLRQNNPFVFYTSDGVAAGLTDLINQSSSAEALLTEAGNKFIFTPNAANNIEVTLMEKGKTDTVQIEILGNSEVTGVLKAENVLYLNANKILTGEFIPEVIPFVSHTGRLREECLPFQYALVSNDAIRYEVVPAMTESTLGHYHKLLVDTGVTGLTTDVMIGNDVVYYQSNSASNKTYFIYHAHGVQSGSVESADSAGLLNWQNNSAGNNLTSSVHTHEIIYPVVGDNKAVYAIKEDSYGNLYVGTSDGLRIVPVSTSYEFVINGVELYFYGNDLWTLLEQAKLQYEKQTGESLIVTEELYETQIQDASISLAADGDSVLITGAPSPDRPVDTIMIKRISDFAIPDFGYEREVKDYEVQSNETIISTRVANVGSDTTDGTILTTKTTYVTVERDFNDTPIWSLEIDTEVTPGQSYISPYPNVEVVTVGSNIMARAYGLEKSPYQNWLPFNTPFFVGVSRKVIKDYQDNYWIATNNGLAVSRSYYNDDILSFTNLPSGNPDIKDLIEGEIGSIYCVSESGLFKTTDGGKDWTKVYDVIGGFIQILRDKTLDRTDVVNGHYHMLEVNIDGDGFVGESIGSGVSHVHEVSGWQVQSTMGHTHTLIVTLYAVDSVKAVWKSTDNGVTWTKFVDLPDGECGDCFAAFGYIYVSQYDGIYRGNGGDWTIVLAKRAYSYDWNYDVTGFYIGGDNVIYRTYDGTTFELFYEFTGLPLTTIVENNSKKYFGYAYGNQSQTFHFKNFTLTDTNLSALVDMDKWYATEGGWLATDPYDVYINYKKTLSTKTSIDRRSTYGYHFTVDIDNGIIDFSATTTLSKNLSIFDDNIEVVNGSVFSVGDGIVIYSAQDRLYASVASIDNNTLYLDSRSTKAIGIPAVVERICSLSGDSSVLVNVYNSLLSNIGNITHDDLENGLSYYSDGRPYKFNDTYLSNILQLTQAIRYVYPGINSEFINSLFYDFRYSLDPTSPVYINNYIDLITSDIYNQKFYDSNFVGKWARSINKILIGYGSFSDTIIVATDIGVFWAKQQTSLEANWFYINAIPYTTYDLAIYGQNRLLAATQNGTYWTEDMVTWTKEEVAAMDFEAYSLGLRWIDKDTYVTTPVHTAEFTSDTTNNRGTINASSGTPYSNFQLNSWVKVTGAGDKNGSYAIVSIGDAGGGFGSQLVVTPSFNGPDDVEDDTVITMAVWWGRWDGETNNLDSNITNTLLVGGRDHISYNDGGISWVWRESSFNANNFVARKFTPLTNGRILLAATGTNSAEKKNYLMNSDDIGRSWEIYKEFNEVRGNIVSSGVSDFDNTVLTVTYTYPSDYVYVDGILDQLDISVYVGDSTIALYSGKIVWNEKGTADKIVVFGNSLNSLIGNTLSYRFIVSPSKINTMAEDLNGVVYYGTDRGMYYDSGTATSSYYPSGLVVTPGYNGTVSAIDISGTIVTLRYDNATKATVMSVTADTNLRGNEMVGRDFYITDSEEENGEVTNYKIIANNSVSPGDESTISIGAVLSQDFVGKRFKIVGTSSRVYLNYTLPVFNNQFNGGTLYIMSNDIYDNFGTSYKIKSSTTEYVDLEQVLVPSSTLVDRTGVLKSNGSKDLQVGQQIRLVDSTGLFTIYVSLDRSFDENSLNNLSLHLIGNTASQDKTYVINSNFKNSITLDTTDITTFSNGSSFDIQGALFEQLPSFSHVKTSVESGHYHLTNTVGGIVSGEIGSFGTTNSSYVTLNVVNTENFNTPVVQYQGDLFKGAEIIFTNPLSPNLRYTSEVVSHTASTVVVRLKATGYWDFTASNLSKVSAGWDWEIDGTDYGYTLGTYYDDFIVSSVGITATSLVGSDTLTVESTTGLLVGDKVRLQDDTLSYQIDYIEQVVDATTIKIVGTLSRTYFITKNPQMKVLRDTFTNTHLHQIRDNEVEPISVEDYLVRGYPTQHSHRVLPLMTEVSVLLNQNNSVISVGSGSIIYKTDDNGDTWQEVVDLNDYLEGTEEVEGSSAAILYAPGLIVGATSGNIFAQVTDKFGIIKLEKPK